MTPDVLYVVVGREIVICLSDLHSLLYLNALGCRLSRISFLFLFCDFIYIEAEQQMHGWEKMKTKLISFVTINVILQHCLNMVICLLLSCHVFVCLFFFFICMNKILTNLSYLRCHFSVYFLCWCFVLFVFFLNILVLHVIVYKYLSTKKINFGDLFGLKYSYLTCKNAKLERLLSWCYSKQTCNSKPVLRGLFCKTKYCP